MAFLHVQDSQFCVVGTLGLPGEHYYRLCKLISPEECSLPRSLTLLLSQFHKPEAKAKAAEAEKAEKAR